jgi:hypothetical protein
MMSEQWTGRLRSNLSDAPSRIGHRRCDVVKAPPVTRCGRLPGQETLIAFETCQGLVANFPDN